MKRLLILAILMTVLIGSEVSWSKSDKIINGEAISPDSWSSLKLSTAALMSLRKDHYDAFCSGSLISSKVIITAAHCLEGRKENEIYVALGPRVNSRLENNKYLYKAKKFFIHENYLSGDEDIGLIVLDREVDPRFRPIPLLGNKEITSHKLMVHVSGYSTYNQKDKMSLFEAFALEKTRSYLEHYEIDQQGNKVISLNTKELVQIKNQSIERVMMLNQFDGGICPGDSGGPATLQLRGQHYLLGLNTAVGSKYLSSHEEFDCEYVSKVTLVAPYLPWIEEKLNHISLSQKKFGKSDLKKVQATSKQLSCQESIEDIVNLYQDELTFDFYIQLKCQKMDIHLKLLTKLTLDCFSRCHKEQRMKSFCDFAAKGNEIIKDQTSQQCVVR